MQQHHDVKLYDVQRAGHALFKKIFGADGHIGNGPYFASTLFPTTDPEDRARFHQIAKNNIVVKTIENMLSVDGMDDLRVDKNLLTYVIADGQIERHSGSMLRLICERVDPTTEVGIDVHLKKLENLSLAASSPSLTVIERPSRSTIVTVCDGVRRRRLLRRLLRPKFTSRYQTLDVEGPSTSCNNLLAGF